MPARMQLQVNVVERVESPVKQEGRNGVYQARKKIRDWYILEETTDPYGKEGLSHIQENSAC